MWSAIISGISGAFTSWNDGRKEIKKAKLETKIAIEKAKARRYELEAQAESNWDIEALRASQHSWKDEWLTIIMTLPFIGAFIPKVQDYVLIGFEYLDKTPYWYQWAFLGIIAAAFGLRWWFSNKKTQILNK